MRKRKTNSLRKNQNNVEKGKLFYLIGLQNSIRIFGIFCDGGNGMAMKVFTFRDYV